MSDNTGKLSQAQKFRGTVGRMITRLEAQISKLEDKPEITSSDSVRIQAHAERIISLDTDFKRITSTSSDWLTKMMKIL